MMVDTKIRNVPELLDATVELHQLSRRALGRCQTRLGTMIAASPIPSLQEGLDRMMMCCYVFVAKQTVW